MKQIILLLVSVLLTGVMALPAASQSVLPPANSKLAYLVDESGGTVFFVGPNQHVYQLSYNLSNSSTAWSETDLTAVTGNPLAAAGGALVAFNATSTGTEHIAYLGTNQHVYFMTFASSTSTWSYADLTALTGNTPAAASSALAAYEDVTNLPAGMEVAFLGANQHVYQLSYNPSTAAWANQDLTALTGNTLAASGSTLTEFTGRTNDYRHVIYLGTNQHIYQLFYDPATALWSNQDLAALTGNTPAAFGSGSMSFLGSYDDLHIFYRGTNQHVYQLFQDSATNKWSNQDLTGTGNPLAASGSPVVAFPGRIFVNNYDSQDVIYLGTNQHVYQLWFNPSSASWSNQDLTSYPTTGNTLAASGSALTGFVDPNFTVGGEHVIYLGTNQHIYQLCHDLGAGTWKNQDLTP